MAKEVFEPTVIKKFKLAEVEPEALSSYMSAFGVPSAEASKYWIAHWLTIGREAWNGWYQRFDSNRRLGNYDDIDSQELAEARVTWDDVKITRQDTTITIRYWNCPRTFETGAGVHCITQCRLRFCNNYGSTGC